MRALAATLLVLLAGSAVTTAQRAVPESVRTAWIDFQRQHGADWHVDWNETTGTPDAIWGPGLRLQDAAIDSGTEARQHAQRVLQRFAALLGTGDSRFVEVIGEKVAHVWVFVYRQRFKGLEVIDGRADVRIHDNGVLSLFGSQAVQIPADFNVVPRIDVALARTHAARQLSIPASRASNDRSKKSRLVIRASAAGVRLAWQIHVNHAAHRKIGRAYVDAKTGELLDYRTNIFGCCGAAPGTPTPPSAPAIEVTPDPAPQPDARTVSGTIRAWTNTGLNPVGPLTLVPVANMAVGTTFTDASGKFTLPGNTVTVTLRFRGRHSGPVVSWFNRGTTFSRTVTLTGANNTITIFSANAVEFDRSQSTCYYHVDKCMVFTRSVLGNLTQLVPLDGLRSSVNLPGNCTGAYVGLRTTYTSDGITCPNLAYATIVQHEWAHGLDDMFNGVALGEMGHGYADSVPILINDDPIIGHGYYKTRTPNYLRTAVNTRTWVSNGYSSSDVWIGFLWDVRAELIARLGKTAGLAHLRKLFLGVFVPDPRTQRAAAREVALIDDNDGKLNNGTPNCIALILGLRKRKIPNPISGCIGIADYKSSGLGCKGTGQRDPNCHSNNVPCNRGTVGQNKDNLAFECVAPAYGATVLGVDVFTGGLRGPTTGQVELRFADATGKPLNFALRTATAALSSTKLYSFTFTSPFPIPPNRKYFVVYRGNSAAVIPYCYSPRVTAPYFRQAVNSTTWTRGDPQLPWSFRVRCPGGPGAVPALSNTGDPVVGRSFQVHVAGAKASTATVLFLGLSDKRWGPFTLPFDLTSVGATGCILVASGDWMLPATTDASGVANLTLSVPNQANLVGARFYNQWIVADPQANPLGATVSDKGAALIGR